MHPGIPLSIALLLLLSAFLVLAEFAIVRVRPTQLEALLSDDPRAKQALEIQQHLGEHLSSVLVGIAICAIALGAIGEEFFAHYMNMGLILLPWPKLVAPLSTAFALLAMTTLHVVLTELVPRSFAIRNAGTWALRTAGPLLVWSRLCRPLTRTLSAMSRVAERLLGQRPSESDDHAEDLLPSEEEFKRLLEKSHAQGTIQLSRAEMIENLFSFSKRTIKEIAVPRAQVLTFDLRRSLEENLQLARTSLHTRIPLVDGDLDRVVGVVHLKELLWALADHPEGTVDLEDFARAPFLVPEMRLIQDLLLDFQRQKQHLALVVNEHGGIDGLVTLEDVLEELVGEIQDEFDLEAIQLRRTRGGGWLAPGTVTLEQLVDHLALTLEGEEGSVTLGGYLQEHLGRVLKVGDEIRIQGWRIRVLSMRRLAPTQFLLKPCTPESNGDARNY